MTDELTVNGFGVEYLGFETIRYPRTPLLGRILPPSHVPETCTSLLISLTPSDLCSSRLGGMLCSVPE